MTSPLLVHAETRSCFGVVVTPDSHDAVVGIAVEEQLPVSLVAVRIAARAFGLIVGGLDPDVVPFGDVTELWSAFDRIERLSASAKTLLAARVDEAGDWQRAGARSAADHLAKLGATTAVRPVGRWRRRKQVADLPWSPRRCGTGCCRRRRRIRSRAPRRADPSVEARLVRTAQSTNVGELRAECLRTRRPRIPIRTRPIGVFTPSGVRGSLTDPEGGRNLFARGTADRMSRIEKALEPFIDGLFKTAWSEGGANRARRTRSTCCVMLAEQDRRQSRRRRTACRSLGSWRCCTSRSRRWCAGRSRARRRVRSSGSGRSRSAPPATSWGSRSSSS